MAASSITIAAVLDGVAREFGRSTTELSEMLPERIGEWFSELVVEFPFWFLTSMPGTYFPTLLPLDAQHPVYTDLAEAAWVDVGWMHTTAGQADYFFSLPDDQGSPLTSTWRRQDVGQIEYVKEFDAAGGRLKRDLEVADQEHFFALTDYGHNGEPVVATLRTVNNQGVISFAPTPDSNTYVFAIGFKLRDFPVITTPDYTNALMVNYPQVVRAAGCMLTAEYFGDMEKFAYYEKKLYGDPSVITGKRNGGLLHKMRKDTQRRRWQRTEVAEYWTSPPYSTDRRLRYTSSTGYFVNP